MKSSQDETSSPQTVTNSPSPSIASEDIFRATIPPGTIIGAFIIERLLLPTINSEIYECQKVNPEQGNNTRYVAKVVKKDPQNMSRIEAETLALHSFTNPFLISPVNILDFPLFRIFIFVRCLDGDLLDFTRETTNRGEDFSEAFLARFFYHIAEGLKYIHEQGFIHGNIKPEKILLNRTQRNELIPLICGFGYSQRIEEGSLIQDLKGTLNYAAPEILLGRGYSYSADVWSYGVTLFTVLTAHLPFAQLELQHISLEDFNLEPLIDELRSESVSEELIDLISQLLNTNPDQRPSFNEILMHSWFDLFYSTR